MELKLLEFAKHGKAAKNAARNTALVAIGRYGNVSGMQSGVCISHGNPLHRLRRSHVSNLCAGHHEARVFLSQLL